MMNLKDLKGLTLEKCFQDGDEVHFYVNDGRKFRLYHEQSCCESVTLQDVCGDLSDLVDHPLQLVEEASHNGQSDDGDSITWTFYRFGTAKGYVTLRWVGSSNGYYSESVDFEEIL